MGGADPRSGARRVRGPAAITAQAKPQRPHARVADPLRVDRSTDLDQEASTASGGRTCAWMDPLPVASFPVAESRCRDWTYGPLMIDAATPVSWLRIRLRTSMTKFAIDDRLDQVDIHLGGRFDPRHLGSYLCPMEELAVLDRTGSCGKSLGLIVGRRAVEADEVPGVLPPPATDRTPPLHPCQNRPQHPRNTPPVARAPPARVRDGRPEGEDPRRGASVSPTARCRRKTPHPSKDLEVHAILAGCAMPMSNTSAGSNIAR